MYRGGAVATSSALLAATHGDGGGNVGLSKGRTGPRRSSWGGGGRGGQF